MGLPVLAYLGTYLAILSRRVDRTACVIIGAAVVLSLGAIDAKAATTYFKWDVLLLLLGLMCIGRVLDRAGLNVVPAGIVRIAGARRYASLVLFSLMAATLSALLDTLVIAVILTPVALALSRALRSSPLPFLVSLVVAANLGGAVTPQGSVPSMLIASTFNKTLADFLRECGPPVALVLIGYLGLARWIFRSEVAGTAAMGREQGSSRSDNNDNEAVARKPVLAIAILAYLVAALVVADRLEFGRGTLILAGALGLLWATRLNLSALQDIEWSTLVFIGGLFVLVGALAHVGVLTLVAHGLLDVTSGQPAQLPLIVLWSGAAFSALFDEVSYAALAVPVMVELRNLATSEQSIWALVLGANFGANASLSGLAAGAAVSAAQGVSIPLRSFFLVSALVTVWSLLIASAYLWVRGLPALGL